MAAPRREILAEGIELWCGDCLDVLPTLGKVGHVICDPPYEEELHAAFGSIRQIRTDGKHRSRHSELDFESVNSDRSEFASALVSASNGWLLVFTLAEGIRAWRDDIQADGGKWHGSLFWIIELKTERGVISRHQQTFRDLCISVGANICIPRGLDQAIEVLEDWNVIRRAS